MIKESYLDSLNKISGRYSGILTNVSYYYTGNNLESKLNLFSTPMPHYEKQVTDVNAEANYHLSGYDSSALKALPRMYGEAIERYAGMTSHVYLKSRIFKSTYEDLRMNVAPISYFNFYTNKQLSLLSSLDANFRKRELKKKDNISWVKTISLFNNNAIAVPAQAFFLGFNEKNKRNMLGISTGTATHVSVEKAMLNAIIEYIQIDAFMSSWYSNKSYKAYNIDSMPHKVKESILNTLGGLRDCYECIFINLNEFAKIGINIWGCFLFSKSGLLAPAITFGLQGDLENETAIIRSFHESLANLIMEQNKFIIKKGIYNDIDLKKIIDMDNNVDYFANPKNFSKNKQYVVKRLNFSNQSIPDNKNCPKNLTQLIKKLSIECPYSSFLDITPPFIQNYRVIRVYIPELLPVTFPSFPQINHPRFQKADINYEYYIHPMP